VTPLLCSSEVPPPSLESPLTALAGEQFQVDYQVHELPSASDTTAESTPRPSLPSSEDQVLVSTALLTRIEVLEAENARFKTCLSAKATIHFGIDQIKHNDHLISFYTGFSSYLAFFWFLGTAVNKLHYWGTKTHPRKRHRGPTAHDPGEA
jgi:hypothetical protein